MSCTFILIVLFKPWINASYSAVLLVHSNSILHDNIVFSPSRLTKIHPTPAPSLDFGPSKYKDQNKGLFTGSFTSSSATLTHFVPGQLAHSRTNPLVQTQTHANTETQTHKHAHTHTQRFRASNWHLTSVVLPATSTWFSGSTAEPHDVSPDRIPS